MYKIGFNCTFQKNKYILKCKINYKKEYNVKKRILQLLTVLLVVLTATMMDAVICVNDFGRYLNGEASDKCENLVTAGSDLYFKANADMMNFFAETEIAPGEKYNFSKALLKVRSALRYLNEAKTNYIQAAQIASAAGYQADIDLLKTYEYDGFAAGLGLNMAIKNEVKVFLNNGDVAGFYQEIAHRLDGLTSILKVLENNLQTKTKPQISTVWEALQKMSDLTLFGNYGTVMAVAASDKA